MLSTLHKLLVFLLRITIIFRVVSIIFLASQTTALKIESSAQVASKMASNLRVAVLLGSTRTQGAPRPVNVGKRIGKYIAGAAQSRGMDIKIFDPLDPEYELPLLRQPHFSYPKSSIPRHLDMMAEDFRNSDAIICITPEYNHCASPALLNTLNHFGSSVFSFKPSAIVSYSAGQWGGTRAAHSLRPVLSELGCLPVSAMTHIPFAGEAFNEDGTPTENAERWEKYAGRTLAQLEWWANACRNHHAVQDPFEVSPAFQKSPDQRNAP